MEWWVLAELVEWVQNMWGASNNNEETVVVDIDMKRSEWVRRWWPFLRDRRIDCYSGLLSRFLK